jgi:hypothetical protein
MKPATEEYKETEHISGYMPFKTTRNTVPVQQKSMTKTSILP